MDAVLHPPTPTDDDRIDGRECPSLRAAPLRLPAGLPQAEDLTWRAERGELTPAVMDGRFNRALAAMTRTLYRRGCRHVLVTGRRGVGKTNLIEELARRAAGGETPYLRAKRFLRVACQNVGPDESRPVLEALLAFAATTPGLVLCLDGLAALLRCCSGMPHTAVLRRALRHPSVQVVGTLSPWDYDELLSADAELQDLCVRLELDEPDEEIALEIARRAAAGLETEFDLAIQPEAVRRAVTLSSAYIWSDALPAKAIKVLSRTCEEAQFERTQCGQQRSVVAPEHVVRVMADVTRVPEEMLGGDPDDTDFEQVLAESIFGQEEAVQAVASELQLIKAGLTDPGKPAAVMLFCGMNGVGKTELAKRLAEIYSASRRLQVYTMGNFVEQHSVSGIIGVPAGYVGHDQGGRLINDLNSDPYGVFLLDEAEKAHPDVWKPFLNLFDEGWIVDQRGTKAYADRAIFILTSNAGYETIAQMSQDGRPMEEIVEHVKRVLSRARNERSGQPVLSQAFLARLRRIVVFRPLDEAAQQRICRHVLAQVARLWLKQRSKRLVVSEELIAHIAREGHRLNDVSGGREGGRSVRRLIADLVECPVQRAAAGRKAEYRQCQAIHVGAEFTESEREPRIVVTFGAAEMEMSGAGS